MDVLTSTKYNSLVLISTTARTPGRAVSRINPEPPHSFTTVLETFFSMHNLYRPNTVRKRFLEPNAMDHPRDGILVPYSSVVSSENLRLSSSTTLIMRRVFDERIDHKRIRTMRTMTLRSTTMTKDNNFVKIGILVQKLATSRYYGSWQNS